MLLIRGEGDGRWDPSYRVHLRNQGRKSGFSKIPLMMTNIPYIFQEDYDLNAIHPLFTNTGSTCFFDTALPARIQALGKPK